MEQSAELQALWLAVGMVCAHLTPPAPTTIPLIEWLQVLPGHVERVVVEGAFHMSNMALEQMVSHFDEIDATVIAEGFAVSRGDEELDDIEEKIYHRA